MNFHLTIEAAFESIGTQHTVYCKSVVTNKNVHDKTSFNLTQRYCLTCKKK
jgi:hypothetical protein